LVVADRQYRLACISVGRSASDRAMIITCPACDTRYRADDASLGGSSGRQVRCAKCGAEWHYAPDRAKAQKTIGEPPPAAPDSESSATTEPAAAEMQAEAATDTGAPVVPVTIAVAANSPAGGRHRTGWILGLALVATAAVLMPAAIFARDAIVMRWPAAGPVYRAIGELIRPLRDVSLARSSVSRTPSSLEAAPPVTATPTQNPDRTARSTPTESTTAATTDDRQPAKPESASPPPAAARPAAPQADAGPPPSTPAGATQTSTTQTSAAAPPTPPNAMSATTPPPAILHPPVTTFPPIRSAPERFAAPPRRPPHVAALAPHSKHQTHTARAKRYVHRRAASHYAGNYYYGYGAPSGGGWYYNSYGTPIGPVWGGGQYGPSPYSGFGQ
jgi:predicted Zn finger-like uncharacterized protein